MIDKKAIEDWLVKIDETKRRVLTAIAAVVMLGIMLTTFLGGDIMGEICGKPENITCPVCLTTTSTTTLPATTSTPTTSIPATTSAPATTSIESYCTGLSTGSYCDGNTLVECSGGVEISEKSCDMIWSPKVVRRNDKMSTEWRQVPGLCSLNSEGADCCTVEICG